MPQRPKGPAKSRAKCYYGVVRNFRLALWFENVYTPIRLRAAEKLSQGRWTPFRDCPEVLSMPRAVSGVSGSALQVKRTDAKMFVHFPELTSWLADGNFSDGKPVGMVQLSIRPKGMVYVVQLRVQDQGGMILTVEDPSLDDALMLLEAALVATPVPWSRDPYPLGISQSKKKN